MLLRAILWAAFLGCAFGQGDLALTASIDSDASVNVSSSALACDGSEGPGEVTCFIASSIFPERDCECVRNTCPPANIASTQNCRICDRGARPTRVRPLCLLHAWHWLVRGTCPLLWPSLPLSSPPCCAGYGVYGTYDECMANGAMLESIGIDPSSYPLPTFPPTACPANSRAPNPVSRTRAQMADIGAAMR